MVGGPPMGFVREAAEYSWAKYDQYRTEFEAKPTEEILVLMEIRGLFERVASYMPFSESGARKSAARDTLKERLKAE